MEGKVMRILGPLLLAVSLIGCSQSESKAPAAPPPVESHETIRIQNHPVTFDPQLGAGVAKIGEGKFHQLDVTLVEIPSGKQLAPKRLLAEEMIYIVSGEGYTLMWNGADKKQERYNWKQGDFLSPTMNAWRQHFNTSPSQPARYLSVSTAPLTATVFQNPAFLSMVDFNFDERWKDNLARAEAKYVPGGEGADSTRMKVGHFLPDLIHREMIDRGEGQTGITIRPEGDMANNHILEMELREFTDANGSSPYHRHFWETVYLVLKGNGSALLQKEGGQERRVDWTEGDLFLVEAHEYHNHTPRGGPGARFLQMKPSGYFRDVGLNAFMSQNKPGFQR
jgi:quercetin dioxygenase-like cupin family protein